MNSIRRILIHCLITLGCVLSFAAAAHESGRTVRFNTLSRDDGLSQAFVYDIVQDQLGFMWFATQEGLNRFDGHNFRVYRNDPEDDSSLSDDATRVLLVDRNGLLWIGTENGGVSRFNQSADNFDRIQGGTGANAVSRIRTLYEDRQGRIWVGTEGNGIGMIDSTSGQALSNPVILNAFADQDIWAIVEDQNGYFWIGTRQGLFRVSLEGNQLLQFEHDNEIAGSLSDNHVRTIFEDAAGVLWVGTQNGGLNQYLPASNSFEVFSHEENDATSLSDDSVTSIIEDDTGTLWIGTFQGLNVFDPHEGRFERFQHSVSDIYSLSHDRVISLYQDAGDVLWVGTYGGLSRWNTATGYMRHYRSSVASGLRNDMVTSFAEDISGDIWVGTFGGGLHLFNQEAGSFTPFASGDSSVTDSTTHQIMALEVDRRGDLWIGTRADGLSRLRRAGGADNFDHFVQSELPGSLSADGVTSVLEDSYGTLWVGTFGGGLNRFDSETGTFQHFRHDPRLRDTIASDRVMVLFEDSARNLWIGTQDSGFSRFNRETESFDNFSLWAANGIGSDYVTMITEDGGGDLWIGTVKQGLYRWRLPDRSAGKVRFRRYSEKDGLPSSAIYAGEWVGSKYLWLSTNNGLARLDVYRDNVVNFGVAEGAQSAEFNHAASLMTSRGKLLFGGVNGFNLFDPGRVNLNQHLPRTVITDVRKLNQSVNLQEDLNNGVLELTYKDYFVSFGFAGMDFTAPEENQYRYLLEGLDENWIEAGNRREATYTNLNAGEYVFKVQSANNSGIWNDTPATFSLRVLPAPWLSWWAYLLYTLAGFGVAYLVFKTQIDRVRIANQVLAFNESLENEIRIRQGREIELRQERDRTAKYLQVAEVVMIELDQDGRIQLINQKGLSLLGQMESRVIGRLLEDFVPIALKPRVREVVKDGAENGSLVDNYAEFPLVDAYNNEHFVLWRAGALAENSHRASTFLVSGMDVTELRQLERAVREKEKMTVMGTLAGGIAHDFNNVLTAVYGYGVLTLNRVNDDPVSEENLKRIISATERAKSLIRRLLTFAQSEELEFSPTNIGEVVVEAGELLQGSLPSTIEFGVDIADHLELVLADPTQVHQLVMNLATNAVKALPGNQGNIQVSVRTTELKRGDLRREPKLVPGTYVEICVEDDGVGMDQETLEKLFDPFYTTNVLGFGGVEKGTGLGMSVSYSIVSSHQGYFDVETGEGEGSRFHVYLPCCEEEIQAAAEVAEVREQRTAHLVLVDDEEFVGDVGSQILKSLGYSVDLYNNPVKALEALKKNIQSVDLLITDETMPGMTGTELVKSVREFDLEIPIIVASGNLVSVNEIPNAYYLSKPYTIEDLEKAVDEALAKSELKKNDDGQLAVVHRLFS